MQTIAGLAYNKRANGLDHRLELWLGLVRRLMVRVWVMLVALNGIIGSVTVQEAYS